MEIDIFEVFNINVHTTGLKQVQGLANEAGNAFKIGKNIPRIEQPSSVVDEIRSQLIKEGRIAIIANVKLKHFSFGTLFSVESKSTSM